MKQHELSANFPSMTASEFEALRENIRDHGQRRPIIVFDGEILDGWHRFTACTELGIAPIFEEYSGDDPSEFAISVNGFSRVMDATQRGTSFAKCRQWQWARHGGSRRTGAPCSSKELAAEANVSERTMDDIKTGIAAGLAPHMTRGDIAAKPAAELARKAPDLVAEVVAGTRDIPSARAELKERESKPKRELPTAPGPDLNAELDKLDAQLMDMRAELIELRAASLDPQLQAQARDEIQGIREALALALLRAADADALLGDAKFKILELQKHNAWLERKLKSP